MAKIKLKQTKSKSGMPKRQLLTLQALGFSKMQQVIEVENTPQVMGMYNKLKHLVTIVK